MSASVRYVPSRAIRDAIKGRETKILKSLGVDWTGNHKHIRCPYPDHVDENPSWRWNDQKKRAHCSCVSSADIFAVIGKIRGGDFEAQKITAAELLSRSDLIRTPGRKRSVAATYDYSDETGRLLFQVVQ